MAVLHVSIRRCMLLLFGLLRQAGAWAFARSQSPSIPHDLCITRCHVCSPPHSHFYAIWCRFACQASWQFEFLWRNLWQNPYKIRHIIFYWHAGLTVTKVYAGISPIQLGRGEQIIPLFCMKISSKLSQFLLLRPLTMAGSQLSSRLYFSAFDDNHHGGEMEFMQGTVLVLYALKNYIYNVLYQVKEFGVCHTDLSHSVRTCKNVIATTYARPTSQGWWVQGHNMHDIKFNRFIELCKTSLARQDIQKYDPKHSRWSLKIAESFALTHGGEGLSKCLDFYWIWAIERWSILKACLHERYHH